MRFLFTFLILTIACLVSAQNFNSYEPPGRYYNIEDTGVSKVFHSEISWEKVFSEDDCRTEAGHPMRVGLSQPADMGLGTEGGKWYRLSNGDMLWQLVVSVPEAHSTGLVFDNFRLSPGAELYVYDKDFPQTAERYTASEDVNRIATGIFPSSRIVIELLERKGDPDQVKDLHKNDSPNAQYASSFSGKYQPASDFRVSEIVYIYADIYSVFNTQKPSPGASGDCQVDINCSPAGDDWQDQKRGVAHILFKEDESWYVCSGTLLNNTAEDTHPYFLTADHCGGSATDTERQDWKFYFNYEKSSCGSGTAPQTDVITGCRLLAKGPIDGGSDFQLVEFLSAVPEEFNPYYNGWNRDNTAPLSGAGIHHPSGDVKKISTFYNQAVASGSINVGGLVMAASSAWGVEWSENANGWGVTEGGSSGSPLFDQNGLVSGTLTGGFSACDNQSGSDYYGRFSYHWETNGTSDDIQLKPWLDPAETNITLLDGYDPAGANPDDIIFAESFEDQFPPKGWAIENTVSDYGWEQSSGYSIGTDPPTPIEPQDGSRFAFVEWQDADSQNEWLISPAYNMNDAYGLSFSFWFNGSPYWSVENDLCDLTLKVKSDGGDWTDLWSEHDEADWGTYVWKKVILDDLTSLENADNVQFAFVYKGLDGASFNVDNIVFSKAGETTNIDRAESKNLRIYPNPSEGFFTLRLDEAYEYRLTDIAGRTIRSGKLSPDVNTLDLNAQRSGMYFLLLRYDNETESFKLIKK